MKGITCETQNNNNWVSATLSQVIRKVHALKDCFLKMLWKYTNIGGLSARLYHYQVNLHKSKHFTISNNIDIKSRLRNLYKKRFFLFTHVKIEYQKSDGVGFVGMVLWACKRARKSWKLATYHLAIVY
jgi:hypothetical protein